MGDRAEVSHQLRTSDDHALRLERWVDGGYALHQTTSIGLGPVRLLQRAPHLRCGARLFVPLAGPWWLGRAACRSAEVRRSGRSVGVPHSWSGPTARAGVRRASGDILRGRGHVVAGGDVRRRRGRESCPRTRGLSPAGANRTRPRAMSPSASGMRSSVVAAEARDPCQSRRSPVGRRSGARLEDVGCERRPST